MNDSGISVLELHVPKPRRVIIGAIVLATFILFFISLAIYDLCNRMAIIPSLIWLLSISVTVIGFCREKGTRQFAVEILGAFSRKEFVRTKHRENDPNEFQYGFWMFGYHFSFCTIPVDKIESVEWHTGQASHFAGRDVGDWHVAVWYYHGDSVKRQKQRWMKNPERDLYLIGLSGPKEETAALGDALLDLLQKSGTTFAQGKDDSTFMRQLAVAQ